MEDALEEVVSDEDLKKIEKKYLDELKENPTSVSIKTQFEYAWCLVRSNFPADIKKGIILLENLFNQDVSGRRYYLYYLSIGNTRIKEYSKALKYCREFQKIEPDNRQVKELENIIRKKLNKEGKIGMAITVAGVFVIGSLFSLGMALAKR